MAAMQSENVVVLQCRSSAVDGGNKQAKSRLRSRFGGSIALCVERRKQRLETCEIGGGRSRSIRAASATRGKRHCPKLQPQLAPQVAPSSTGSTPIARGLGMRPNSIQLVRGKLLNTLKLPWKRFLPCDDIHI